MWSDYRAWQGQNAQVGGIWPAFKGNVTIKPCNTVVLDLDLNVQLYSLIVMQQATLVVANRATADVKLRATCIWVKEGGRLLAGRPALPTSFAPEVPPGHPAILPLPRCWQGTCAGLADRVGAACGSLTVCDAGAYLLAQGRGLELTSAAECPLTCCLQDPSKSGKAVGPTRTRTLT